MSTPIAPCPRCAALYAALARYRAACWAWRHRGGPAVLRELNAARAALVRLGEIRP